MLELAKSKKQLYSAIVNAPFEDPLRATYLGLGIVVLLLVDKPSRMIRRIALSDTEAAKGAIRMSNKPFKEIEIPVGNKKNIIAEAIRTKEPQVTYDWYYLFTPALSAESAKFNQAGAGIEYSAIFPLKSGDGGALIYSFFQLPDANSKLRDNFASNYTTLVDTFLENNSTN